MTGLRQGVRVLVARLRPDSDPPLVGAVLGTVGRTGTVTQHLGGAAHGDRWQVALDGDPTGRERYYYFSDELRASGADRPA